MTQELYIKRATDYLDIWLDEYMAENAYEAGLSVSVMHKDELLYSKNIGYANAKTKENLTDKHLFRMASQSKTLTAIAIMQLVEQGKLKLDDKLVDYLDFFKKDDKHYKNITIRQVMSHSAGLTRDTNDADFWVLDREFLTRDLLKDYFSNNNSENENNLGFCYSNIGYAILGLLIEELTGQTYQEYIKQNIFDVVNADYSTTDYDEKLGVYANGHTNYQSKFGVLPIRNNILLNSYSAAAGLVSTTQDMCKIHSGLIGKKLISRESKKELLKITNNGKYIDYLMGLESTYFEGSQLIGHTGGFTGQTSVTFVQENTGLIVSVALNSINYKHNLIIKTVFDVFNFFECHKDNLEDSDMRLSGLFLHDFAKIIMVPLKDKLCFTSDYFMPFQEVEFLDKVNDNDYTIIDKGSKYIKKSVKLNLKNNQLDRVVYNGFAMYKKDYYFNTILKNMLA